MLLDIIVVISVALGFYLGFQRGLIKTVFDTLSLFIGVLAALKLSPITIHYIEEMINISPTVNFLLGLVITFLLVLAIIRFVGKQIENLLQAININIINRLAGGALQGLFFAFLISLGITLLDNFRFLNPDIKKTSATYSLIEPLPEKGRSIFEAVKPLFKEFYDKTVETIDEVKVRAEKQSNEQ